MIFFKYNLLKKFKFEMYEIASMNYLSIMANALSREFFILRNQLVNKSMKQI